MAACGVPFETLDNKEVMRRYPQFDIPSDVHATYQAQGGIAAAAKGNAAHQRMAQAHGATLIENVPVLDIKPHGSGYELKTRDETFRCARLVIAAGPWTNHVLKHFGLSLPLKVNKEQVSYFASPHIEEFRPGRFPVWIWMIEDNYYGFPVYGAEGVKVSKDTFTRTDPDTRTFDIDPENEEDLRQFMTRHMPRALGPILYTKTCILTHTPDVDFVIDHVPGHPNCTIVVGAAHAYKFACVIGRILSELAISGQSRSDIEPFRFDRPALAVPGA
jgi:sarcosine oxidase